MLISLYRLAAALAAAPLLRRRAAAGKEDPARLAERRGDGPQERPAGRLVWLHGASVGESLSILPLIDRLLAAAPDIEVLVTTGTRSSAALMAQRLPARCRHRFIPIDRRAWVRRFLDRWRPDLAVWVESELWPNLLLDLQARTVPALLVNARMSDRSFRGWQRLPGLAQKLLGGFTGILAWSERDAQRYAALGGAAQSVGNLKYAALPLPVDEAAAAALATAIGSRRAVLLASTHDGEEAAFLDRLPQKALLILAPRHPQRGAEVAALAEARGLRWSRRSSGALPAADTQVYIADSLGEMGLLFRQADIALIGGSFVPHGGHNPLEALPFGCAVLWGPHMDNFTEMTAELLGAGAGEATAGPAEAMARAEALLADEAARAARIAAGQALLARHRGVLDRVAAAVLDALPPPRGA